MLQGCNACDKKAPKINIIIAYEQSLAFIQGRFSLSSLPLQVPFSLLKCDAA